MLEEIYRSGGRSFREMVDCAAYPTRPRLIRIQIAVVSGMVVNKTLSLPGGKREAPASASHCSLKHGSLKVTSRSPIPLQSP